jgi:thymidylate synthase (FAD)
LIKVKLLDYTPEPERVVAMAARLCYSASGAEELAEKLSEDKVKEMVRRMVSLGHGSTLEHASFTFGIEGVSRVLTHQLVRHRIASYDQQSQRYVNSSQFEYVIPPSIEHNADMLNGFKETMQSLQKVYDIMIANGIPKEDARFILPNACQTRLICSMNIRTLVHFFSLRLCSRAQWEIRAMANEMWKLCNEVSPVIFGKVGAACKNLGYCPEGHMSCGRYPTLKQLIDNYKENKKEGSVH